MKMVKGIFRRLKLPMDARLHYVELLVNLRRSVAFALSSVPVPFPPFPTIERRLCQLLLTQPHTIE